MADNQEIVVITKTLDGLVRIGPTPPPGVPLDFATIETYEVSGPRSLHENQQLAPVLDAAKWIESYAKIGFRFHQVGNETKEPSHPLAKGLDPTASYTAEQIAAHLNRSTDVVELLWRNWHNGKEPRLNSRLETGRGAPRVSSAYDLLVFINQYGNLI